MSSYNSGGPSGLSLIVLYIIIGAIAYAMVSGSLAHLIPVGLGIWVGLWTASIIAGR